MLPRTINARSRRWPGRASVLAESARVLASEGELRLAGHLAELAYSAASKDPQVCAARAKVNKARQIAEPSLMAKAIFRSAAASPPSE